MNEKELLLHKARKGSKHGIIIVIMLSILLLGGILCPYKVAISVISMFSFFALVIYIIYAQTKTTIIYEDYLRSSDKQTAIDDFNGEKHDSD